ncbi:MAG TPA: glycosyltransferase, partial [Aigarchaeota archaeon]|nr:glycosyltransferase [Aigarchaeota archaeon]
KVIASRGGKGCAISTAIRIVSNTEYIIFTDADYTYPASKIPEMIKILDENPRVGAVLGDRFSQNKPNHRFTDIYSMGNLLIKQLYRIRRIPLNDPLTGLRVVRWKAIKNWSPRSTGFEIETEMNVYLANKGWLIKEVPIRYRRRYGRKKLKIYHALPIIKTLLTYSERL